MLFSATAVSLMLIASTPFASTASIRQHHEHLHVKASKKVAQGLDGPLGSHIISTNSMTDATNCAGTSCLNTRATSNMPCDNANGTEISSGIAMWTLLCDIDFYSQDIYPFILAGSFEKCMQHCEDYNDEQGQGHCAGFVFAPDRVHLDNDCYLKSTLNDATYPATIHLIGASLHLTTTTASSLSSLTTAALMTPVSSSLENIITPPSVPISESIGSSSAKAPSTTSSIEDDVPTSIDQGEQNSGTAVASKQGKVPTVVKSTYLGTSVDDVAVEYVSHVPDKPQHLADGMIEAGVNIDLITDYPLAPDTGSWTSSNAAGHDLAEMSVTPRLSRDGGRGGNINGTNIFIFCDTSTYGEDKHPTLGYLNGFVSSSVAVDESMNALQDKPLNLINSLGQWQDDVGRMRGWVPMTTGEEAFNTAISGQGYRYAIWPNSSPISLNESHAIMYAPLVYLEVDMQDQSSPRYTSLGNTLLLISVDSIYGPHAERLHNQFFEQDEINWGSLGGIRALQSPERDASNGDIYVFGQAERGILLGKVSAADFSNRDQYSYWDGDSWSKEMPPQDSSPNAFMIDQPVMSMDLIYSPYHKTFIMIYLTPEADNTFYYRYLVDNDNSTLNIEPGYEDGGDDDYVEDLLTKTWSEQQILFTIDEPERGYAYAGGLHAGYFGDDDITNGGTKMLCTWTEHTAVDPDKPESGYAHKSQVVEFSSGDT